MTQWYPQASSMLPYPLPEGLSPHIFCSQVSPLLFKSRLSQSRRDILTSKPKESDSFFLHNSLFCFNHRRNSFSRPLWPGLGVIPTAYEQAGIAISGMLCSYRGRQPANKDKFGGKKWFRVSTISVYNESAYIWFHKCGMEELSHFIIPFKSNYIRLSVPHASAHTRKFHHSLWSGFPLMQSFCDSILCQSIKENPRSAPDTDFHWNTHRALFSGPLIA